MIQKKKISIIVAIAEHWVIGKDNQLLWHLPDDLKWFKKHTTGCDVIMGRKTYESLPFKPLPNRKNIVISSSLPELKGCEVVSSLDKAIQHMDSEKENFVIGGENVYHQFLPIADKLYITFVHHPFEGDAFFPQVDFKNWKQIYTQEHPADEKHALSFTFTIFERA